MNRRAIAIGLVGVLVLGTLGGVAATAFSGSPEPATPSGADAVGLTQTPEVWLVEARAVYDSIGPLTDQASAALEAEDDAAYAAANAEIARALDGMPAHPNAQVDVLYAAVAEAHREIAATGDIDAEATFAAQSRVITLLERVHQIVPPF